MAKKTKNPSRFSFLDFKFGIYSALQSLNAVIMVCLIIRITTYTPNISPVQKFLEKADSDLHLAINNTASICSNLVKIVYSMPQLSSSSNTYASLFDNPEVSLPSTNFVANYVSNFGFSRSLGRSSFSCSEVAGSYYVGDIWIDGGKITAIHDKGFSTTSGLWFASSAAKPRPVNSPVSRERKMTEYEKEKERNKT